MYLEFTFVANLARSIIVRRFPPTIRLARLVGEG
jgi:hypothetical protein